MRARLTAACALTLISSVGCAPFVSVYHKTGPRRVDVQKQKSKPGLDFEAQRDKGGVYVVAKRSSEVKLTRQVHYNASAQRYMSDGNPLVELVELVVAPFAFVFLPTWFYFGGNTDTADRKTEYHTYPPIAMLHPGMSAQSFSVETELSVEEEIFADPPTVRRYLVSLPAADLEVSYTLLDQQGQALSKGSAKTDVHGRIKLASATSEAIAVRIRAQGVETVAPILLAPGLDDSDLQEAAKKSSRVVREEADSEDTSEPSDAGAPPSAAEPGDAGSPSDAAGETQADSVQDGG